MSLIPTNSLLVEISPELRSTMYDYITSFNKWSLTGTVHRALYCMVGVLIRFGIFGMSESDLQDSGKKM